MAQTNHLTRLSVHN